MIAVISLSALSLDVYCQPVLQLSFIPQQNWCLVHSHGWYLAIRCIEFGFPVNVPTQDIQYTVLINFSLHYSQLVWVFPGGLAVGKAHDHAATKISLLIGWQSAASVESMKPSISKDNYHRYVTQGCPDLFKLTSCTNYSHPLRVKRISMYVLQTN